MEQLRTPTSIYVHISQPKREGNSTYTYLITLSGNADKKPPNCIASFLHEYRSNGKKLPVLDGTLFAQITFTAKRGPLTNPTVDPVCTYLPEYTELFNVLKSQIEPLLLADVKKIGAFANISIMPSSHLL